MRVESRPSELGIAVAGPQVMRKKLIYSVASAIVASIMEYLRKYRQILAERRLVCQRDARRPAWRRAERVRCRMAELLLSAVLSGLHELGRESRSQDIK
jgi:hypothetical protein